MLAPLLGFSLALGLLIGSFLNVVIHRVPQGESVLRPRSRCPGCRKPIAGYDNVPVLSFLWLRGRCRHCGEGISWRYPMVEAMTGLVFAGIVWAHGWGPVAWLDWLFAAGLIVAAGIDFDEQWIPDTVSLGGLALGLIAMPFAQAFECADYTEALRSGVAGAVLGGGLLWVVGFVHARLSVALGRRFPHWHGDGESPPRPTSLDYWIWFPGLGFGDVKLMAMVGAFLGPAGVLQTILLAAALGLVVGLVAMLARAHWNQPFGFGPSIAVAAVAGIILPILEWVPRTS